MRIIETKKAPKALGPYSQGIYANGVLYTSGQLGINPETNALEEGIDKQANQAFKNIGEILAAEGLDFSNVVKTTVFLSDLKNFAKVNEIYATYFISNPARSCVEVASLPKGALLEIEVIAVE